MTGDKNRFMWDLMHVMNTYASDRIALPCFGAGQEVHVPGEYAPLQQWLRMIRPGRRLL